MLVSRKASARIRVLAAELAARVGVVEAGEEGVDFLGALVIGRETGQPVAKHMVERGVSRSGLLAGLLDQPLFGAEGDVFHRTKIVRTGFVSNRRAREASPCDSEAAASGHGVPKSVIKRPRADWLWRAIWRKSSEIRGSSATRCQKSLAQPIGRAS